MVREIVKPTGNTYLLQLPDDLIGKTVEVIAFEVKDTEPVVRPVKPLPKLWLSRGLNGRYGRF